MSCPYIPDVIELSAYKGDYHKYEQAIFHAFEESFANKELVFRELRIAHKKHPEYNGKSYTFWHIISDGKGQNEIPDMRRYERVAWAGFILENCVDNCERLRIWENKRGWHQRILIWCVDAEYLIVLEKREQQDYVILWTAYPVNRNHTKRKLEKEYYEYKAKTAQKH